MGNAAITITETKLSIEQYDCQTIELPLPNEERVRRKIGDFADANTGSVDFAKGAYAMAVLLRPEVIEKPADKPATKPGGKKAPAPAAPPAAEIPADPPAADPAPAEPAADAPPETPADPAAG